MTAGAVLLEALKLVALWAAVSIGLGVCWVLVAIGAGLSRRATPAARAAAPRWLPQLDPRPLHQRYLRGYWTPDGKRLTTLAGSPQVTSWFGFTDRELIAARQATRTKPATDDTSLAQREATVTSIACLMKREGMKATRRAAGWN